MLNEKTLRYRDFQAPFLAYRAKDINREVFADILTELKELQEKQHEDLHAKLEDDEVLKKEYPELHDKLVEAARLFDEAVDIALDGLNGPSEEEKDLLDEALETFKKGNVLLADSYYAIDDIWEKTESGGML